MPIDKMIMHRVIIFIVHYLARSSTSPSIKCMINNFSVAYLVGFSLNHINIRQTATYLTLYGHMVTSMSILLNDAD